MNLFARTGALLGVTLLAACATPTPFQEAEKPGGEGYTTTQVSQNVYRVSFLGNQSTDRQAVETALLFRAAQVAKENGRPYFRIIQSDTERNLEIDSFTSFTAGPGFYGRRFGRFGYYRRGFAGPAFGNTRIDIDESFEAMAFVELLRGPLGEERTVFEAQDVLDTLRPQITFPQARSGG